jgi:membrane-associated phospholipid phosphatase
VNGHEGGGMVKSFYKSLCLLLCFTITAKCPHEKKAAQYIAEGFHVIFDFNKNLFSWDTLTIIAAFAPFYIGTRFMDKEIHDCFYCRTHHKNIHQFPKACHEFANIGVGIELVALALLSVFPVRREIKDTAIVFGLVLPFMWAFKKILKEIKVDGFDRPKNQFFCRHKKAYGGCPSGHVLTATYAAAYWGMQLGPKWGVPLGLFAIGVFADLANCNRHYISQMVAGAGLGFIGAVAASKAADKFKMRHDVHLSLVADNDMTGLKMSWAF